MTTFAVDIDGTITENGGGRIHLGALGELRSLVQKGHRVIFVTGRSSVEGYMLAMYGGTTPACVGENGGCITTAPARHTLIGSMRHCRAALDEIAKRIPGVREKPVFPRLTEIVLERTFDIEEAKDIVRENRMPVVLADSTFAFHINSAGVDKGSGLKSLIDLMDIKDDIIAMGDSDTDVSMFSLARASVCPGNASAGARRAATISVPGTAGDGITQAIRLYEAGKLA